MKSCKCHLLQLEKQIIDGNELRRYKITSLYPKDTAVCLTKSLKSSVLSLTFAIFHHIPVITITFKPDYIGQTDCTYI